MDTQETHSTHKTASEAKKNSFAPVVVGGFAIVSLLLAVTLIYKNVSDKSAYQSSSRAQSAQDVSANAETPGVDTSDAYIDQEIQALDNELSLYNEELNEVDQKLSDQQDDLAEEGDDPVLANDVEANHRGGRNEYRRGQGRNRHERQVRLNAFQKLQNKTLKAIDRRVKELNRLKILLSKVKSISHDQKTTLLAQINEEIKKLTSLKAKVKATRNISTLRTYAKSVGSSYKGYAFYVAKVHIIIKADKLLTIVKNAEFLVAVFDILIKEVAASGQDVSHAKFLVDQMRVYLTSVKDKANQAIAIVLPLTPAGYPANKTELQKARALLRSGHFEMKARHPHHPKLIRELLRQYLLILVLTPAPTAYPTLTPFPTFAPSPTVTPTPTATPQ